jgi:hypothetical protein
MVFGDSRDLFAVLVVDVGLKGFTKTDKEEGIISFSGTIGGRILYGEYKQGVYCTIYVQRKQFDPLYEQKIPVFSNIQINLCDFFECDSKATDQMKWVSLMNNLKISAEEMVMKELIYS